MDTTLRARRALLIGGVAAMLMPISEATAQAQDVPIDAEAWMKKAFPTGRDVTGSLRMHFFKDPFFGLLKPIEWLPSEAQSKKYSAVKVPTGFVSDLASIPRAFFSLFPPNGEYSHAAVIHDYLYWTQSIPKRDADDIFGFAMEDIGVGSINRNSIMLALKLPFSQLAWDNNRKARLSGEKRTLKVFPDDPKVTWQQWKLKPEHFME